MIEGLSLFNMKGNKMKKLNDAIIRVTDNIRERSLKSRNDYLLSVDNMNKSNDTNRSWVGCSNLAHAAASTEIDKISILKGKIPNIAIVSAYNLSLIHI